jgi:hypothetical protein
VFRWPAPTSCHHLPVCRLKSLPADILSTIARRAGRPTSRASRLLSNAHGPLGCGLRLDGLGGARELLAMAALRPHRFDHVTSVVLTTRAGEPLAHPTGILLPLCNALPKLAALSTARPKDCTDLAGLAPLVPHLTALNLPRPAGGGDGLPSLLALTGLRSLAIPLLSWAMLTAKHAGGRAAQQAAAVAALHSLGSLRCLRALEWLHGPGNATGVPAEWFASLSVLGGLTSLLIRADLHTWDPAAVATLRTGFPELSALALSLRYTDMAVAQAAVAALAQRTALTSLQLWLGRYSPQVPDLRCLSTLRQLGSLAVQAESGAGVEQIVGVLGLATGLTSLHLGGYCSDDEAAGQHFRALGRTLEDVAFISPCFSFGSASFAAHLGCLTLVTSLRLEGVPLTSHKGPLGLGKMSCLEVLHISVSNFGDASGMLDELDGLGWLRDLTLSAGDLNLQDVHLWQLLPLCHTLTRLALGGTKSADTLRSVQGPGLAVVGRLTCLHELKLCNMEVMESRCLHEYLLPLPASLRRLELESDGVLPGVQASLQAAAGVQDCAVRCGSWVL